MYGPACACHVAMLLDEWLNCSVAASQASTMHVRTEVDGYSAGSANSLELPRPRR